MKANTKPDYELLERYILGSLESKSRIAIEKLLREDRAWFEAHLELKEALLLSETGQAPSSMIREKVLGMVKRERTGFVSILITIVKEKITISSADQSGQDFQGVSAEFALRGESEAGPVTISRRISGRSVTILLTPLKKKNNFALSVLLEKEEPLEARLIVDELELERLPDVSQNGSFSSHLAAPCNVDMLFLKKGNEEFTVNLKLRSESDS
jgi:hypothetical protein